MHRKAAALLHGTVANHGFVDANKRTAWLLVEILVQRSRYRLDIGEDDRIDDLVLAVADNRTTIDEIATWFAQRLARG